MIRKKSGEIQWLEFEILQEEPVVHGIFLRHGGMSAGTTGSLNAGSKIPEDPRILEENRRRMLSALNIPRYCTGTQVHGNEVVLVKDVSQEIGDCDGLITQLPDLGLLIRHADCQATVFYDPINRALANVHSGWRGNVKNIYDATVKKMAQTFGSKPENLLVGVSPSLGPDHAQFIHYKTELPEEFWQFQVRPLYFDLWAIARHQLENSGILPHHIQIAGICTYANEKDCFSYRRDKLTGNHAAFAMLRPSG